ncbi:cytidylate kinase [Acinetobacter bereziniae]|uniref:hypothetical protein n=1 Tax=Acinetobacter bereziniae TaxID=106648 RepID=UPI00285D33AE|nr:hypothetical protein [Acinetobacter bereziniae]MDR6541126.1 cytidylate kinase [Acinetobacter bereziniae]
MNRLESENLESQEQSEQKESSTVSDIINSADPIDLVDLVVETSKIVVNASKDIVSNLADHIDIDISF